MLHAEGNAPVTVAQPKRITPQVVSAALRKGGYARAIHTSRHTVDRPGFAVHREVLVGGRAGEAVIVRHHLLDGERAPITVRLRHLEDYRRTLETAGYIARLEETDWGYQELHVAAPATPEQPAGTASREVR